LEDCSLELPRETSLPVPVWFPHLITDTKSRRKQGAPVISQDLSIFARLGADFLPARPLEDAHAGQANTVSELLEFWNWAELVDIKLNTLKDYPLSAAAAKASSTLPFPEDRSLCAMTHKLDAGKRVCPLLSLALLFSKNTVLTMSLFRYFFGASVQHCRPHTRAHALLVCGPC
jgi:hypothetical protein